MEKAKGRKNSTKSREDYLVGQSQPASVEPKLLPGTSASRTKWKRSVKEDEASCSEKMAQGKNILRAWCQEFKLSTKGQKLDVYKRICKYAYPHQKMNIPTQRRLMMDKGEISLESPGTKIPSDGTYPPEAPDAMFASWSRIAARAGKMETVASPQEAHSVKWCVVHGRSTPADTEGRICALFLLPTCDFSPPQLEDNMLCPKCVHRNKVLMKSLQ
ncbi:unnamed protein product [Nyctereutes procyonoides]|uniref:(raccoon dog) hypothetical protein n=1 Tax=Nyctereutes procyonoides TaxID=34880 RepID=A0A811ZXX3_NYCPR|nr:unnamed protein product [Nyctereutes procyonoides]